MDARLDPARALGLEEGDVKQTAARIQASPFVSDQSIRGFVYEVETGHLREVSL